MTSSSATLLVVGMVAQWLTAAGTIWLTWWAAQSRDPVAFRAIAMLLVVGPALLWPLLSLTMTMDSYGSISSRAFLFGVVGAGIAVVRALFLVIWAIVSKDRPYLRIGGGIVAGVLIVGMAMQALSSLIRL